MIPEGATHVSEFYGTITYYRLTHGTYINRVIDHPKEQFQKTDIWRCFENGQWINPGHGFSPRRLTPLKEQNATEPHC